MTYVGTHDVLDSNPYKGTHSHRYTLNNSDHHLYFDNPEGLIELLFRDLANLKDLETTKMNEVNLHSIQLEAKEEAEYPASQIMNLIEEVDLIKPNTHH